METNRPSLPDPALTANIYCAGLLDEVIYRCIAPFAGGVVSSDPERRTYLWLIRYLRGGEHLKIRIHAPEDRVPEIRSSFEAAVNETLATLRDTPPPPAEARRDKSPPIDAEDEALEGHPDRSLLFTRPRRSYVSLGGKPLLDDDVYVSLFTQCLGAGCDRVLAVLKPDKEGKIPFRARQITLLKAAISGLGRLGWSEERRSAYFIYHRDWLLRFIFGRLRQGPDAADAHLAKFDANVNQLGPALGALQKTADGRWSHPGAEIAADDPDAAWCARLSDLSTYVARFAGDPAYELDPFAPDPVFPAVFKALHGLANQLGLKASDEAFAHHLLLRLSGGGGERRGFSVEPSATG